ncbi:MAG: UvrD-helicase domain-containing protein [Oligoflexia bacterium]|nr:UvrD-helicase domain-containing protein [Oligoflexia bacterium]
MSLNLNRLNPNQREAVLHRDGPLLVLAGAGSGKTSTMAYRIAHLIAERHVPALAILGLSFTNKAAGELKERVSKLVTQVAGARACRGLTISTFHSLCVRILRAHGGKLGFQPNFTILDENDQKDVLKQIFRNIRIDDRKFDADRVLFEIGQAKSKLLKPAEAEAYFLESKRLTTDYALATASSFAKYQEQLRLLNAMDFDDLLYHAVALLENHEDVREHYNQRFRYVLVDEYQDTNPTQFRLLSLLTRRQQNLCVVGDDDQSIYSWRGADAAHILEFARHYPGARTILLDQNYRSTNLILRAANEVISKNSKRHPKSLWSERGDGAPLSEVILEEDRAEAEWVAREIFDRAREQHRPWKDFAILYRSNAQSRSFEEALRRYAVPYKIVGGMSFLDRKEVKDVLSYWRLVANLKDDASLRRVLNWPARGIGKATIEALGTYAFENHLPIFEALERAPVIVSGAKGPSRSEQGIAAFRALILGLRQSLEQTPASREGIVEWARRSIELMGAKKAVEEECDEPAEFARKWDNVEELVHSIGQLTLPDPPEGEALQGPQLLQEFLNRMTLDVREQEEDSKDERKDSEGDQVTLLTLHGSKGLEFPVVFLVGAEEGFLPHKRTIEEATDFSEERRLCYVGITRAKDHLVLTRARNRIRYGKPVPRLRSRFLQDIPLELLLTRDESHGPDDSDSAEARKAHEEKVSSYLSGIKALLEKNKG